jgi:hypothetical protein
MRYTITNFKDEAHGHTQCRVIYDAIIVLPKGLKRIYQQTEQKMGEQTQCFI